jgi:hypothetical protein
VTGTSGRLSYMSSIYVGYIFTMDSRFSPLFMSDIEEFVKMGHAMPFLIP